MAFLLALLGILLAAPVVGAVWYVLRRKPEPRIAPARQPIPDAWELEGEEWRGVSADDPPRECGSHPDCAWGGCPGCSKAKNEYFLCPKCKHKAAFVDFDGSTLCMLCRERFHAGFEDVVSKLKVQ